MVRATRWTEEKVKALKLPEGKAEQRVLVEPGLYLYLRARSTGEIAKQWQFRAQVDGVRRWLSLGSFPAVGLAKAHAELLTHRVAHESAKKGEADHPVTAARFARKAARAEPTVAEVFAEWLDDKRMGSPRKGGEPVRERTIQVLVENFNADIRDRIGDGKIAKLSREGVQACIDAPRKRSAPGAAAHVFRTLKGLTNFAIKRGYIEGADPMRGIENPRPYRPAPVNAASDAEVLTLLRAVEDSKLWEATKLAIDFQLLTGARPTEVRLLTWDEISEKRSLWTIPKERFKSGREHRVHLSQQALAVLERAKVIKGSSPFVFPGSNANEKKTAGAMEKMAIARALSRIAKRTEEDGGKKLSPHDLRRTFRTMLSRIGVAPHVAELCLGHIEKETMRRVYDGHDYTSEMIDAWDKAGAHIAALRRGSAQVIPIMKGRA
ncbi:tyrosine-type recombinase/integrase [Rhizobacter fulvus]